MKPADLFIPPISWNVFVNNYQTIIAKYTARFAKYDSNVLRMVKNIAEQHRVD